MTMMSPSSPAVALVLWLSFASIQQMGVHAALPTVTSDWPVTLRHHTPGASTCNSFAVTDLLVRVPEACNPRPQYDAAFSSRIVTCPTAASLRTQFFGTPNIPDTPNTENYNCSGTVQQSSLSAVDQCLTNDRNELDFDTCYTPGFQDSSTFGNRGDFVVRFEEYQGDDCLEENLIQYRYVKPNVCRSLPRFEGPGGSVLPEDTLDVTLAVEDMTGVVQEQDCNTTEVLFSLAPGVCAPNDFAFNSSTVLTSVKVTVLTSAQVEVALPEFSTGNPPSPSTPTTSPPTASPVSGGGNGPPTDSGAERMWGSSVAVATWWVMVSSWMVLY